MSHSLRDSRKSTARQSTDKEAKSSSSRRSGHVISDDRKSTKSSDTGTKQTPAYRRWDQSTASSTKAVPPPLESSVEEQISRANAIADMDTFNFMPQNFISKRQAEEDKPKSFGPKENAGKGLTGVLAGPVDNLISPNILPKTEEERNLLQAQILTALRRDLFEKRNTIMDKMTFANSGPANLSSLYTSEKSLLSLLLNPRNLPDILHAFLSTCNCPHEILAHLPESLRKYFSKDSVKPVNPESSASKEVPGSLTPCSNGSVQKKTSGSRKEAYFKLKIGQLSAKMRFRSETQAVF